MFSNTAHHCWTVLCSTSAVMERPLLYSTACSLYCRLFTLSLSGRLLLLSSGRCLWSLNGQVAVGPQCCSLTCFLSNALWAHHPIFTGCGSQSGSSSVCASLCTIVSMAWHRHISLRVFVRWPTSKAAGTRFFQLDHTHCATHSTINLGRSCIPTQIELQWLPSQISSLYCHSNTSTSVTHFTVTVISTFYD